MILKYKIVIEAYHTCSFDEVRFNYEKNLAVDNGRAGTWYDYCTPFLLVCNDAIHKTKLNMKRHFIVFSLLSIVLGFGVLYGQGSAVLIDLPPQSWYEVPNSNMRAVCPPNEFGGKDYNFQDYCPNVISAWSGGVYDTKRNRLVLWGGGHNDYYGNELYAFDVKTFTWERITDPDLDFTVYQNCRETHVSGNPEGRHTYGGLAYIAHADRFFAHGGSLACGAGSSSGRTWTFDFDKKQWLDMNPKGIVSTWDRLDEYSVYDQMTGHVFLFWHSQMFSYDYDNNEWIQIDDNELVWSALGVTIDSKRGLLVEVGNGFVRVRDIRGQDFTPQLWNTIGGSQVVNSYAPGIVYDPIADRVIGWNGGAVYSLNMDNQEWTRIDAPGSPGRGEHGIFGRFRYIPQYNVFIVVTDVDDAVYFYKNTAGLNGTPTAVEEGPHQQAPKEFRLIGNYPNPFNPDTKIQFDISIASRLTLTVYDMTGRAVRTLIDHELTKPGRYAIPFDASKLASGTYFYRISTNHGGTVSGKMLLLK